MTDEPTRSEAVEHMDKCLVNMFKSLERMHDEGVTDQEAAKYTDGLARGMALHTMLVTYICIADAAQVNPDGRMQLAETIGVLIARGLVRVDVMQKLMELGIMYVYKAAVESGNKDIFARMCSTKELAQPDGGELVKEITAAGEKLLADERRSMADKASDILDKAFEDYKGEEDSK